MKALSRENINEVITLSEDYKATSKLQFTFTAPAIAYQMSQDPVPRNELSELLVQQREAMTNDENRQYP